MANYSWSALRIRLMTLNYLNSCNLCTKMSAFSVKHLQILHHFYLFIFWQQLSKDPCWNAVATRGRSSHIVNKRVLDSWKVEDGQEGREQREIEVIRSHHLVRWSLVTISRCYERLETTARGWRADANTLQTQLLLFWLTPPTPSNSKNFRIHRRESTTDFGQQ